jgi:hypothetical protein
MLAGPNCGREEGHRSDTLWNLWPPERRVLRLLSYCGAPSAVATPTREQRKRVSILFCDVSRPGPTAVDGREGYRPVGLAPSLAALSVHIVTRLTLRSDQLEVPPVSSERVPVGSHTFT